MQSKFSIRPPARKVPCIIHPAPPPDLPRGPGELPLQLSAMAHWRDLDPLLMFDLAAYIDLWWVIGLPKYFGRSPALPQYLTLELERTDPLGIWTFTFTRTVGESGTETMVYPGIAIDPAKPFNSGYVGDVHLPGLDFRSIYVLE